MHTKLHYDCKKREGETFIYILYIKFRNNIDRREIFKDTK